MGVIGQQAKVLGNPAQEGEGQLQIDLKPVERPALVLTDRVTVNRSVGCVPAWSTAHWAGPACYRAQGC
jgi:hypothetical protein